MRKQVTKQQVDGNLFIEWVGDEALILTKETSGGIDIDRMYLNPEAVKALHQELGERALEAAEKKRDAIMFRPVTEDEVPGFKKFARDNYVPGTPINSLWHPVVRLECVLMNIEAQKDLLGSKPEGRSE